ncbi:Ku protein [Burkholderia pseudomallei]|uniref:non-homologous end joining protein Ku n=1 Tax=Burkholderia pseudomallei TaxID=28450 RepID=UPI00052A7978|nr:Ku protein [Burkholderia pseudomallei]AIV56198.1 Ku protein [Burkholderia pseudomallei MSHR2243]AIV68030.1 Ku protein [Burkholderia pseudomallei MSHR62]KGT01528.1 Ku protein [Burkholderia pseudomallei]KGU62002.1 Ku protein [Burkholderia pseudomallei MSHR465J]KGW72521.1 Ku protein [Burkholderia pseudomallei MSHR3458]
MARMIWKGAISFGLVHVPVQLYPATRTVKPSFRLLDKRSLDPVGYRQINKRTGKAVPREDIVRGYEYEKERYVILTDEEIRAANPESTQTVDILTFVDDEAVSFLYLDTPYYLVPDRGGEKVYALLRDALKRSGKIGIALVVMRDRQHLGAVIPVGPLLALDTLRWQDELRPLAEIDAPAADAKKAGVSAREFEMAAKLIDDMSGDWSPDDYHDTFRDDILALVDRKVREGRVEEIAQEDTAPARRTADIVDLTELLKRSLGRAKGPRRAPDGGANERGDSGEGGEGGGRGGRGGGELARELERSVGGTHGGRGGGRKKAEPHAPPRKRAQAAATKRGKQAKPRDGASRASARTAAKKPAAARKRRAA